MLTPSHSNVDRSHAVDGSNYAATLIGLRRRLGFSQQQLATKVGAASKAVVYQWESGKRKPSPGFWLRIERLNRLRPPALESRRDGLASPSGA
jgi:transcriptional regulator with XRE-family HTH domain